MYQAAMLWRVSMVHMAALNGIVARKALPDWRRRELRAVAESRLNEYFNEIDRIIALSATPDTHRREATAALASLPISRISYRGQARCTPFSRDSST
jgi:hypothetical protein